MPKNDHITLGQLETSLGYVDKEMSKIDEKVEQKDKENDEAMETLREEVDKKAPESDLSKHTGNTTVHITSTERTNWNDANSKKHTHSNKTVLDGITSALISAWNSAVTHISDAVKHITEAERTSWNAAKSHADSTHAPSNAQANQNAFSNVKVGNTTIAADAPTDTLTFEGDNVTLTPDAANDKVVIGVTKANVVGALGFTPPSTDTKYTHPSHTARASGLYKITVDSYGHVVEVAAVTKADITGLGIPAANTDTKNTAGATDSGSKLFLIGALSQGANPQTYSHDTAYIGTDGCLYSGNKKVSTDGHTHDYLRPPAQILSDAGVTASAAELNKLKGLTGKVLTGSNVIGFYGVAVTFANGVAKYTNANIKANSIIIVQRRAGSADNNNGFATTSAAGYVNIYSDSILNVTVNLNLIVINNP